MIDRLVKFLPTLNQVARIGLECSGLPANIHKNNITLLVRVNLVKWIVAMINGMMLMHIRPDNMGGFAKMTIQIISPSVIGAGNRSAKLLCLAYQNHAAMTTNIFKDFDFIILVTHQQ